MAVGDAVNGIGVVSTLLTFQPALGVVVCITSAGSYSMKLYGLTDGVSNAWMGHLSGNIREQGNTNSKIFINNTNYLHIAAPNVAEYACYSGIQIK